MSLMQEQVLNVIRLPRMVAAEELAGSAVVVIDVLRATTTICQALASGAREVVPFLEIEDALAAANEATRSDIVLGGERFGKRIDQFDLGNSPSEYIPAAVDGRRVFITTTNGTRALRHARLARRVLVGAFVNLSAVVASIQDEPRIDILCAGTDGAETGEDVLLAGALVHHLCQRDDLQSTGRFSTVAAMARARWGRVLNQAELAGRSVNEQLAMEFRDTPGGHNLVEIGMDHDLADCARIDRFDIAPELDVSNWRITLPGLRKSPR